MFGALGLQHPKLWPTRSDNNTAQDYSVLDTAFVLIDAIPYPILVTEIAGDPN
jgi:hypothetical protein